MDRTSWLRFFKYMSIINFGFLVYATVANVLMADFAYELLNSMFPMELETYSVVVLVSLTFYKILWFTFNVVPWIALSLMGRRDQAEGVT